MSTARTIPIPAERTAPQTPDGAEGPPAPSRRGRAVHPGRGKRFGRRAVIAGLAGVAVVLASAVTNAALDQFERGATPAYGERIPVEGGSLDVYRHGSSGPTIVMLGGYGTPSPALDFAPLIRELDGYRVVVVEGFGYGYSDTDAPPRTIENITSELHQALHAVGVEEPYVLLGHSISGIYDLYYANRYPSEVSAVVGVDASVPGQLNGLAGQGNPLTRLVSATGLLRLASTLTPSLIEPDGTAYTAEERERMRLMTNWNWSNPALLDEADQSARNFSVVANMTYPADVPVLSFIKKEGSQDGWKELHERQLRGVEHGELVELDGGHYLHWTQSKALARSITEFLQSAGVTR
jgi:pimeloyl-ACP methyl ester carboxylesterase